MFSTKSSTRKDGLKKDTKDMENAILAANFIGTYSSTYCRREK